MKTKNKKEEKENKNLQKLLDNIAEGFNSKYSIDLDENSSSFGIKMHNTKPNDIIDVLFIFFIY